MMYQFSIWTGAGHNHKATAVRPRPEFSGLDFDAILGEASDTGVSETVTAVRDAEACAEINNGLD